MNKLCLIPLLLYLVGCAPTLNDVQQQNLLQVETYFQDEVEPHMELAKTTRLDIIDHMGKPFHIYQYSDGRSEFQYVLPLYSEEMLNAIHKASIPLYGLFHKEEIKAMNVVRNQWISFVFLSDRTLESYTVKVTETDMSGKGMEQRTDEKFNQRMHFYEDTLNRDALVQRLKIGRTTTRQVLNLPDLGEPDEVADGVWIYRFAPRSTELAIKAAKVSASLREKPTPTGADIAQGAAKRIFSALVPGAATATAVGQYAIGAVDTVSGIAKNALYTPPTPFHLEFDENGVLSAFYFVDPGALTAEEQEKVHEQETSAAHQEARP